MKKSYQQSKEIWVSHVGLCVSDIERSSRFYCEGLGFTKGVAMLLNDAETKKLTGIEGEMDGRNQFIYLGNVAIELIEWKTPQPVSSETPRPFEKLGFTHLSLRVQDIDNIVTRLEGLGGRILHESRISLAEEAMKGELVFCVDPDGNRVELMDFPDEVRFY